MVFIFINSATTCQRMKVGYYVTQDTKVNSKWTEDLNVIPETIKLLEENVGAKLLDIGLGDDFFGSDSKSQANKSIKVSKWDYQNKNLLHGKGNHQQNEKAAYWMRETMSKSYIG